MSNVGQRERMTQQRIVELFQTDLGYRYLGNWEYRDDLDPPSPNSFCILS